MGWESPTCWQTWDGGPPSGAVMRKAFSHFGSSEFLTQFAGSLLSTGCHPNVRPETAMGVSPPPPSLTVCPRVWHLILHGPRRLGPECAAALRVSRVVLATKRRMNPNTA